MKYIYCLGLGLTLVGCSHSEFDVSAYQVAKRAASRRMVTGNGEGPDLNHLPPGAVKHEMTIKKGQPLPDGTIADRDTKMVTIEGHAPSGDSHRQGDFKIVQIAAGDAKH
jgi:hypothetical protein